MNTKYIVYEPLYEDAESTISYGPYDIHNMDHITW